MIVVKNGTLNLDRAAMHSYQPIAATFLLFKPQAPQAHELTLRGCEEPTRESVSCYKRPSRLRMKNKILRSANDKFHYSYPFYNKINKGDLPLMYSCVFWCEFVDLVVFFWLLLFDPCHVLYNSQKNRLNR